MADPKNIETWLRTIDAAMPYRHFRNDEEVAHGVLAFSHAMRSFSDDAVTTAANEWIETMTRFPAVMEFTALVRTHHNAILDRRAVATGGPVLEPPRTVGKPGSEQIAADIVLTKMMNVVAKETPKGFFGRLKYGNDWRRVELFDEEDRHARQNYYAALAFQEVVDFCDSTVTDAAWEGEARDDRLRECRDPRCDHGWVTYESIEHNKPVERVQKCTACSGPKASTP